MRAVVLVAVMAVVTSLLRFLLVIFCLKDVSVMTAPHGLPELIAAACVVLLQVWKRNSLLSILAGTALYMILIRTVF